MLTSRANGPHRTWEIRQTRAVNYDVRETTDVLHPSNPTLLVGGRGSSRRLVVVDEVVYATRAERLKEYFEHHGVKAKILPVTATEPSKSFDLFFQIARELDAFKLNRRNEPVIALGGGVLLDVVSFVASCYRRGTPCVRVPTTLMGLVDAAIGIKTAVNFDKNKNRIGSFEAPFAAILDRTFLATLPMRHILNGVGEIMKLALIRDAKLFELLESEGKAVPAGLQAKHRVADRLVFSKVREPFGGRLRMPGSGGKNGNKVGADQGRNKIGADRLA